MKLNLTVTFFALTLLAPLALAPAWATPTENNSIRVLPAPGKVTIDGKFDDWDLSGSEFICDNVETQRDDYAVWMSAMEDSNNLYLLARWTDKTPLNNPGQTIADYGWSGDCLQVRFHTNPNTPNFMRSVINAWKGSDGNDVIQLDNPLTHHSPWGEDIKPKGAQQAFTVNADGKGYVQEIAIPWKFLTKDGQPVPVGGPLFMTFEPNFTVGIGGRMSIKDNFKAGITIDRVFTFQNYPEWGPAVLTPAGHVTPQPVRLADGREFPVHLANGVPVVDWNGLIVRKASPGFIPVTFTMPKDGYISLNIKDANGHVVDQLLQDEFFSQGPHTVNWDGLPTPNDHLSGPPVPAGTYTWSAIYNTGIGLKLRGWAYNSGQQPWDNGPQSNWGGDEGVPSSVATDSLGSYLGWSGAEAGRAIIATDHDGKVRWTNKRGGFGGVNSIAADGNAVYLLSGGSMYKLSPTVGAYVPWGNSTQADLDLSTLFPVPAAAGATAPPPLSADAVAARGGDLYLSFGSQNKIAVLDAGTGALKKLLDVPSPGTMWARSATQLYAISGGTSVQCIDPTTNTAKPVLTGLTAASGITGSDDGTLYIGKGAPQNQVEEYDATGKLVRTFGRPGGRVTSGAWDPNSVLAVSALALDSDGHLWVCEESDYPKRFSEWNAADGTFTKEFFGPTLYGAVGGAIDPQDPDIMAGGGCEWRLDPVTGQAHCVSVITTAGMQSIRFATGSNGRLYLVVAPGWNVFGKSSYISIYERLADGSYKLRSSFFFEGTQAAPTTRYWADANGDGVQQPEESTQVDGWLHFDRWYLGVSPDLSIYFNKSQYKVTGFTPCGAPLYDLANPTPLPDMYKNGQPNQDGLGTIDDKTILFNGYYMATRDTFQAYDIPSGQLLWTYPNNFIGVHGSHNATGPEQGMIRGAYGILGTAKLPAPVGNIWAIGTNVGEWHLLTQDGYYLARLFEPDPLKIHWPDQPVRGADMTEVPPGLGGEDFGGSMTQGTDGKIYIQAGKTAFWNLEVTGLDTVAALPGGKLTLTAADLPKAERIQEAELQQATTGRTVTVHRATPTFTGKLDVDFKGSDWMRYQKGDDAIVRSALAYDDTNLYAAWDVADTTPWTNGAKRPEEMYIGGDTVDLQLGTDPAAAKNRTDASLGDLRLSIGNAGGQDTAELFRRIAKVQKPETFNSGVFKNYVMQYVGPVPDARILVTKGAKGYVVEAAIPLADLDFSPAKGTTYRGDMGVTYGDEAGERTRLRVYWSNQTTGIVDDQVAELMMEPRNWGDLAFGE